MPRTYPYVHSLMPWAKALDLLEKYGFHVFWQREFDFVTEGRQTQVVADHRRKKLLLVADSIYYALARGKVMSNEFRVYGVVRPSNLSRSEALDRIRYLGGTTFTEWGDGEDRRYFVGVSLEYGGGLEQLDDLHHELHFVDWELTGEEYPPILLNRLQEPIETPSATDLWAQLTSSFPRRVKNFVLAKAPKA